MKKIVFILAIIIALAGCKEQVVEKPAALIAKEDMVNIMYDLSLLEAIKYQNIAALEAYKTEPSDYVYKKYNIDSSQFVQSNKYYASNFEEYKEMFDQISVRLEQNKAEIDTLISIENKKKKPLIPLKKSLINPVVKTDSLIMKSLETPITKMDSLEKKPTKVLKVKDSIWPLYTDEYLKIRFLKRF